MSSKESLEDVKSLTSFNIENEPLPSKNSIEEDKEDPHSFTPHSTRSTSVRLKQPKKAVWNRPDRRYRRHSVERDVQEFVGWPTMMHLIETARTSLLKGLLSALFLTGGRISEVLWLRKENFEVKQDEGIILVKGMRLLKRYRKIDGYVECRNCGSRNERWDKTCVNCGLDLLKFGRNRWVTEKIDSVRIPFPIELSEPYVPYLMQYLERVDDFLFLNPYTQKPYTRSWAYSQVRELGSQMIPPMELYDHWFRAQRASQLADDYDFDAYEFKRFFGWATLEMSAKYVKKWKGLLQKYERVRKWREQT